VLAFWPSRCEVWNLRLPSHFSFSRLVVRWNNLLGLNPGRHERGFLGRVPYILLLRYFISLAMISRFWLHRLQYTHQQWLVRMSISALIVLTSVAATGVLLKPALRGWRALQVVFILADITFISAAYYLTNNPESDFFLFYYLPIFATVEYLGDNWVVPAIGAIDAIMSVAVFSMHPIAQGPWTTNDLVFRVLIPRWIFFGAIVLSSAFVFSSLSRQQAELRSLLDSLHAVSARAIPKALGLDGVLEHILSELTGPLKFDFATASLVDEYRNCIETVRGRNVPPGWVSRAKHALGSNDIQAKIVRSGKMEIIAGWSDSLDREIFDRFDHWRYARIFTPIFSTDGRVVGTLEAGCLKERHPEVFTPATQERLNELGRIHGEEIARARSHAVLEMIAGRAIELIGADSASLHVYRRGIPSAATNVANDWGELILAAGAGKATHEFVRAYQPRNGGRGQAAIQEGSPEVVNDPQRVARDYPEQFALGVRAFAHIPLVLEPDAKAVLTIHFWQRDKKLTQRDLNLAAMFAREMEVVIQNHLLFKNVTEVGGLAWAFSGLKSLMQSLTSPFHLPDVLKQVARNALLILDASNVSLYQYHADTELFDVPPVTDGDFLAHDSMREELSPDDALFTLIVQGTSQFVDDVSAHPILSSPSKSGKPRFIESEKIKSGAVLILKPEEGKESVGLLFVNFREAHRFSIAEKRVMDALATSAGLAIRTARLHTKQLEALHAVLRAIASKGPELKAVMERLLEKALELTGAQHGVYMSYNRHKQRLDTIARWPNNSARAFEPQKIGEGVIGLAAQTKKSILLEDVNDDQRAILVDGVGEVVPSQFYRRVNPETQSEIAVPLVEDGEHAGHEVLLGILNVEHVERGGLNKDHLALMERLAVPAIIAHHTVDLYKRRQRRIDHLHCLNLIAARVQEKPYELDTIIHFFLTGITAGEGLGFSRCMLFLAEDDDKLRGNAALGAVTREEAERIWDSLGKDVPLEDLLRRAEQFSDDVRGGLADYPPLSRLVRRISLNINDNMGAICECVHRAQRVTRVYRQPDEFRRMLGASTESDDLEHAFACVPLIGRQAKSIGVMVVDKKFITPESEIDDEELGGLEAFSRLLAVTIENTRLRERMAEVQAAGLIHTVEKRVGLVRNSIPKLRNCLESVDNSGVAADMGVIVTRLEEDLQIATQVFKQFRMFTTPQVLDRKMHDLRTIAEELCTRIPSVCGHECSTHPEPLTIWADKNVLFNAFMEILTNADEAMTQNNGNRLIAIRTAMDQSEAESQLYALLEVDDNGPGIPSSIRETLFEPFVTAGKSGGTGLGLANARKIIEAHGGEIYCGESILGGAQFVVQLPLMTTNAPRRAI
jgi:GAF domain-containing protein